MRLRRILLGLGLLLVVAYGTRVLIRLGLYLHDPHGVMLRMQFDELSPNNPPGSPMTDQHASDLARLNNDIGRRSSWSDEDERWLLEVLAFPSPDPTGSPYTNERGTPTNVAWERYFLHTTATAWIGTRLGLGVPTPQPIVDEFEIAVLMAMEHTHDGYRSSGMASAYDAGWLGRPDVRAAFERIRDNDPLPRLRSVADRRLRAHDGLPVHELIAGAEPCPTCPGKTGRDQ